METVFSINNIELLVRTVPWVYRTYHAHGFSFDYFPLELKTWKKANTKFLQTKTAININKYYSWLIEHHDNMISLSQSEKNLSVPVDKNWLEIKNLFITNLLDGEHKKCLQIANEYIKSASDIEPFYLYIIQPVMYEIGLKWENDDITIAHEHLASAIVGSIMSAISMLKIQSVKSHGKIVITSCPNEFHEIGAWMLSDVLENEGWDVTYLGANTPQKDLISLLKSKEPDVLAISVTIPFNIHNAKKIIEEIKNDNEIKHIKIMIGGRVFNENKKLWQDIGADGFAENLQEARQLAEKWRKNGN
jgi:methanogenic corrinoid protein MtbC1